MKFFSRRNAAPEPSTEPPPDADATHGKGRPTPSRREAEAQRKQSLRVPADPKEAKRAAKARAARERSEQRAALLAGDEAALPPRDAGPVKRFVRDFVDGRFALAELFLPLALVVVVVGFLPWERWGAANGQGTVTLIYIMCILVIVIDTWFLIMRMNKALKKRWPDPADRKGTTFYAVMRVVQLRRLRLPAPRVRRNGQPVAPKKKRK